MKYSIGEQVRIKATGEKVKILAIWDRSYYKNPRKENQYYFGRWILESELKPFRPSRTGKYRNEKGQFTYKEKCICSWCDKEFKKDIDLTIHLMGGCEKSIYGRMEKMVNKTATEESDSKQRNYQKILTKLDEIEKKIDELGRRV